MNNQTASASLNLALIDVPPAKSPIAKVTKALNDAHRDLLDLTARGAPIG